jgi:hypothetical protein
MIVNRGAANFGQMLIDHQIAKPAEPDSLAQSPSAISGAEQNATIVFRSAARLRRSEPFLAKRRSYHHSRRRRSRAAPWQRASPAAADQILVVKGRQS